ncbi:hypothetical protein CVT24_011889 [Panaeolus cyanescens]|uniref:Fructose-bisphosphate aldolase n=1 Tax=Panaeolus cyanescens TaxID=181874 RepID=A0A409YNT4_9AGAR|nr:hypothetical protein CVT24_011889 [Panaeolus cyanescens]
MRLQGNRTLDTLFKAERARSGVLAQMVVGLIRAAEPRVRRPAILQLMPVTMHYGKESFLQFCLDAWVLSRRISFATRTRRATIPMSVHLDHAVKENDIEYALQLAENGVAFDSIMIDASAKKTDEDNLAFMEPYIQRAHKHNIAVEVEFGHMEGGLVGLEKTGGMRLTDPHSATEFMKRAGAQICAPSIGNTHGIYNTPPKFHLDIVRELKRLLGDQIPLCLHGTTYLDHKLLTESIQSGMTKIQYNADTRDKYVEELTRCLNSSKTLPDAVENMSSQVILITGAGGFLGNLLASSISEITGRLILTDTIDITPPTPATSSCIVLTKDLTQPDQVESLFHTHLGLPDVVYCLHGIMSRGAEDNFDMGLKINVDSVRSLLDAARRNCRPDVKFIFASSLAVYGGPLPEIITPSTVAIPQSSYGMEKLMVELLINDYTRRGWIDGRVLRLPTIVVRAGAPSNATSSFLSGIVREPLRGVETTCPIGNSLWIRQSYL